MYLIYLDESGNTGTRKDPDQPIHMIAGLVVHESKIRAIEDAVDAVVRRHFAVISTTPDFELHGADLYSGNGFFKGVPPSDRVAAIHEVFDVLNALEIKVIWAAVDKIKLYSSWHPHQLAFLFIVERIEDYLQKEDSLGLLVADENKEVEQRLIENLQKYKRGNTGFGWRPTPIRQIVDSIHFVQSKNNHLIQCVDLIAYFALKRHRQMCGIFDAFIALPNPKPDYRSFITSTMTPKRLPIEELGRKIELMTAASKVYPS